MSGHDIDESSFGNSMVDKEFHDQEEWAISMHLLYVMEYYRDYFSNCEIHSPEYESNQGGNQQSGRDALKSIDTNGVDILIEPNVNNPLIGSILITQRIRTFSDYGVDLSIRKTTRTGQKAEWYKWQYRREKSLYTIPALYGFGIADGHDRESGLDNGLKHFCLYNLRDMIDAIIAGEITPKATHNNKNDKSSAVYIDRKDIEEFIWEDAVWGKPYPSKKDTECNSINQKGLKDY